MDTSASRTTIRRAAAAAALIAALALTGCQSSAVTPHPSPVAVPAAPQPPAGVDTSRGADRVAEAIERNQDRMHEYSKRFAGRPADRVVEELAREAAAAPQQH